MPLGASAASVPRPLEDQIARREKSGAWKVHPETFSCGRPCRLPRFDMWPMRAQILLATLQERVDVDAVARLDLDPAASIIRAGTSTACRCLRGSSAKAARAAAVATRVATAAASVAACIHRLVPTGSGRIASRAHIRTVIGQPKRSPRRYPPCCR